MCKLGENGGKIVKQKMPHWTSIVGFLMAHFQVKLPTADVSFRLKVG
jgi:hypothetical protein